MATSQTPGSTPRDPSVASSKGRPSIGLTSFPQIHEDEPEPGLLPSLLSKVKSTFVSVAPAVIPTTSLHVGKTDKGVPGLTADGLSGPGWGAVDGRRGDLEVPRTEAQRIAEAVKNSQSQSGHVRKSSGSMPSPLLQPLASSDASLSARVSPPLPSAGGRSSASPSRKRNDGLKPPGPGSSSSGPSNPPSFISQTSSTQRDKAPINNRWKPRMAPSTTTVTPITSVTHSVAHKTSSTHVAPVPGPSRVPFPSYRPTSMTQHSSHPSTALNLAPVPSRSSHNLLLQHAHSNRARRSSIATLPDSPTSSHLVGGHAELSQNRPYMGGFSLGNDDSRSVRSVALGKKGNQSVSRIIRRLRGEGLSKHYWMADEHCKECYDCKSIFTTWRRKHHCRICGQIFCGRCAATIIDARRFGQEGSIRVCNLCLRIMEEYKEDDDDDRRSVRSLASARLPSFSGGALMDKSLAPDLENHARSPFAASQLFAAQADDALDSIDEGTVPRRWRGEVYDLPDRPDTPFTDDEEHVWATRPSTAAPFRRPMDEDAAKNDLVAAKDPPDALEGEAGDQGPSPPSPGDAGQPISADGSQGDGHYQSPRSKRVGFPRTETMASDITTDTRMPLTRMNSNVPLIGLRTRLSSRASQGGLTSLVDSEKPEGLWRTRSHSVAQKPEALSGASLAHFHLMLRQAIARAELPHPEEWQRVLSKLLLKVSTRVNPDVPGGDSMDVRSFVKVKKVPGGKISDSEYVDGIVITKNVAHKAMPRRLVNPRIMLLTFPLDYNRIENQFMSLEPIIRQEKDYLRLLTKRIIDVRPHIVLVERTASRIALEYLLEANIAVVKNVKLTAIQQVARCTQSDLVAMDKLALEPRLGRCAEFQIQSFEHSLIPGRRKTLMRFEGCPRDHGCTIVLRGGDIETLRRVKLVTNFMSLVAYHLKNEVTLYNDEHNILPPNQPLSVAHQELLAVLDTAAEVVNPSPGDSQAAADDAKETDTSATHTYDEDERALQKKESARLTRDLAVSLKPYLTTVLSASAAIRFPPPAPLAKLAELDRLLAHLRLARDEEEAAQILQEETKTSDPPKPVLQDSEPPPIPSVVVSEASDTPVSDGVPTNVVTASTPLSPIPSPAPNSSTFSTTSLMTNTAAADAARDPYRVLRNPEEIAKESALASVEHEHAEQVRQWEWYIRKQMTPLRPEDFQDITFLSSMGCEGQEKPCVEPKIEHISFYADSDYTVGQYLEKLSVEALQRCTVKTCERLYLFHFRLLVHGDRRLQIAMDQFPCPSPGHEDCIITWSYCRQCGRPSPTTIIREEMWRMSWGSYLEHCFYPPEGRAGFACPHDAYRDQIRYFAYHDLAIRIHNESIDVYEPVRPSVSLQVKVETRVILKNREYQHALQKNAAFFDSVLFRLRSFDYDIVQPEQVPQLKASLEALLGKAVADREEMVNLLNRTYKLSPMTDVLALNPVLRSLQDKVVQWDNEFVDVEKSFMPSEKDLKRLTASHLKKLFPNQEVFNTLDRNIAGVSVAEADEKKQKAEDEEPSAQSEPPTPAISESSPNCGVDAPPPIDLDENQDDSVTPCVTERQRNPLSEPATPGVESDSTISAVPRHSPSGEQGQPPGASELHTDNKGSPFVSRIPRRAKPAPNIADIVKRFQGHEATKHHDEDIPVARSQSSRSLHRTHSHRSRTDPISDSDAPRHAARPRLRRGKTDQTGSQRSKDRHRPDLASDAERSYAHNASRLLQPTVGRRALNQTERPGFRRTNTNPSPTPSGRTTPEPSGRIGAPPMSRRPTNSSIESISKPRVTGKGKMVRPDIPTARTAPSLSKTATRRILGTPGTRVTSIARHFDRLQREAEKERQKRVLNVRNKRARPVTVTKAKVQVFDNLRDAFKDEFDTDSSEADNEEEEEQAGYESADSRGMVKSGSPSKSRQPSPKKAALGARLDAVSSVSSGMSQTSDQSELPIPPTSPAVPIVSPFGHVAAQSGFSDNRSEMSFTDRLQIELPSFETSAPLPSMPATPHLSNTDTPEEGKLHPSAMSQVSESEMSSGGGIERNSIIKTLTGLWAFRAGEYSPLEYPLSASEHLFADSKIIIRENEPTSIIAFTLSSKTYRDKMKVFASRHLNNRGQSEAFMPEEVNTDRASTWDIVSIDEAVENEEAQRREAGTHLKYDFESGSSTIFCRIFFAEQFAALRSACNCEDSFVESLARCISFDGAGGKSGSAFLKTKDDRFIAKEISRLEMDALTKFAPAYFDYTRKAFHGQRPSVLAKIYGFFKIGYRNAITGRSMRMNVLIMENLFYDRRFSKIYDLKGSTRNRLIQPTGRVNEVLLDENLMELVYKHPLYLREHSKRILRSALFNDTLFLSNLNVMDYSLVVGVDSEKKELVVGIVDYIRTFTWDKKLESWVKDSAFLGGAGKGEPTIVTPKQYKTRFRTAMERFYFPSVPDRWTQSGADDLPIDDETNHNA